MSGSVDVLSEPTGGWVVACFRSDCPEHGDGSHFEPWVDDFDTRFQATCCAREHRAMIANYWQPDACPSCGQRVPRPATEEQA